MNKYLLILLLTTQSIYAQDRPIGINLTEVKDWWPQFLFKDAFKQSREWVVQPVNNTDEIWDKNWVDIPSRNDGYPTHVPFVVNDTSHTVTTVLLSLQEYGYPEGSYTFSFDGSGQVLVGGDAVDSIYTDNSISHSITVTPSLNGINITILESDSLDPIHNIQFFMPGFDGSDLNPFHPKVLELIEPFHNIRFMPLQEINAAEIVDWKDRATKDYYRQGDHHKGGMALEYIMELANITQKDIWINIPVTVNDSFVVQYAQMVDSLLNEDQHVYLEFGNEIWNPNFNSYTFCHRMGDSLSLDTNEVYATWKYAVKRSLETYHIWEQNYTRDSSELSKVLSPQMGWLFVGQQMLSYTEDSSLNPLGTSIDAIALAPYFFMGEGYPGDLLGPDYWVSQGWEQILDVDDLMDSLEFYLASDLQYLEGYKELADDYGLDLHAYESGQHLSVIQYEENDAMGQLMIDANRHPRMKNLYCDFFDLWYETSDGGLLNSFDLMTRYDYGGMWGLLEHMEQDTADAPKWMAHVDCVFEKDTIVNVFEHDRRVLNAYVQSNSIYLDIENIDSSPLLIYDLLGKEVIRESIVLGKNQIDVSMLGKSVYILQYGAYKAKVALGY